MSTTMAQPTATGGTDSGAQNQVPVGGLFGVPKYGTMRRFVPDSGNANFGAPASGVQAGNQVALQTTKLDQLDIVNGMKVAVQYDAEWTQGAGETLTVSPFWPASIFQQITYKLQAAYNTFNLTGALAAIIQAYRPMQGNRQVGVVNPDAFCNFGHNLPTFGSAATLDMNIDIPFAWKFDEFFNLDAQGNPLSMEYDKIVTPFFMAAQARNVTPTFTLSPQLKSGDLLGAPVAKASGDTTSTYTFTSIACQMNRDAWWTSQNPAANPPQYPWLYTRDYFTNPTSGQGEVGTLIQNTGVSVGQVMSLFGFVWDPEANSGLGQIVPFTDIDTFEIVTGGSLQNWYGNPQQLQDEMRALYGFGLENSGIPSGVFVFDFALDPNGGYISNANVLNTYLVNGVQLNIKFKSGSIPSATSTVYMGVEALKLATS